jgi:hypothetical protein
MPDVTELLKDIETSKRTYSGVFNNIQTTVSYGRSGLRQPTTWTLLVTTKTIHRRENTTVQTSYKLSLLIENFTRTPTNETFGSTYSHPYKQHPYDDQSTYHYAGPLHEAPVEILAHISDLTGAPLLEIVQGP